jgi:hypothetical protein
MATALTSEVILTLQSSPEPLKVSELIAVVEHFVSQHRDSVDLIAQADNELEDILAGNFDLSSPWQIEVFVTVLYHLKSILPTRSISSRYFDVLLRPALRDAKLPTSVVRHAKEVILTALEGEDRVPEFSKRLFDLYLLDAFNESSSEDIMEWAELEQAERERLSFWKSNLEDVLVKSGLSSPKVCTLCMYHSPILKFDPGVIYRNIRSLRRTPHASSALHSAEPVSFRRKFSYNCRGTSNA